MTTLTEADVEQAALDWLATRGCQMAHGPDTPGAEGMRRCRNLCRGSRGMGT